MNTNFDWKRIPAGGFYLKSDHGTFEVRRSRAVTSKFYVSAPVGWYFDGRRFKTAHEARRGVEQALVQSSPEFRAKILELRSELFGNS